MYTSGSGGSASAGSSGKSPYRGKIGGRQPPQGGAGYNGNGNSMDDLGYGQAVQWLSREKFFQPPPRYMPTNKPVQKASPRDISEPPPGTTKKRLPLPDIFYYGDRWQEQETRSRSTHQVSSGSSLETPEPPPGHSSDMTNNNNSNR